MKPPKPAPPPPQTKESPRPASTKTVDPAKLRALTLACLAEVHASYAKLAEAISTLSPTALEVPPVDEFSAGELDLVLRWHLVAEKPTGEVIFRRTGVQCVPDLLAPSQLAQAGRTLGTVVNLQIATPLLRRIEKEVQDRIAATVEMSPRLPRPRPTTTLSADVLPPEQAGEHPERAGPDTL
jgi:hypothetical protein